MSPLVNICFLIFMRPVRVQDLLYSVIKPHVCERAQQNTKCSRKIVVMADSFV